MAIKNNNQGISTVLQSIRDNLTVEDFIDLCALFEKDAETCVVNILEGHVPINKPECVDHVNEDDLCNCKLGDCIDYLYSKGESPKEGLINLMKLLRRSLLPAGGFITGDFQSISFEQIPEHPIAKINFSEKRSVCIKAKNNVIELEL